MTKSKLIAGGLVLFVIGISWFTILKKATSKENTQHITVESGGTATIHTEVLEDDSSGISLNIGVEHTVNGSNKGDTTLITGISYKF